MNSILPAPASADQGIHSRAMLVRLTISGWNGRRFDRKITEEVNAQHCASKGAGRFNKHLLGGNNAAPSHANAISKGGAARLTFYSQTLPWADEGWRLLPTKNYEKFTDAMRKAKSEHDEAVEQFVTDYPGYVDHARLLLNGMYRDEDYPSVASMREKFNVALEFAPVPSAGDFRLDLPADQLSEIERSTQERVENAVKVAMSDAWSRLRDSVAKISERLNGVEVEGKRKGKAKMFHDTLIDNAANLSDALSRMNVTNDPDLEAMRQRVSDELSDLSPNTLRRSPRARREAAKSADDILKAMDGLYGGRQ
ncbi:MAG TPA: hypothetical protein VFH61_07005 [Thermoleophilia bacterium]|nr:hypothetical protein [Thermoleophilia bacterium]